MSVDGTQVEPTTDYLFSYGTLRHQEVQLSIFGRRLVGEPDRLVGYKLTAIEIADPDFVALSGTAGHHNLKFTGVESDRVEGVTFRLSEGELARCDDYEPAGYARTSVQLASGKQAWVYLDSQATERS